MIKTAKNMQQLIIKTVSNFIYKYQGWQESISFATRNSILF